MIKVKKELLGDFVVLTVTCEGLPNKTFSVNAEALYDGTTTIEEQVRLATEDARRRLKVREHAQKLLQED